MITLLLSFLSLIKPPLVRLVSSLKFWTFLLGVVTTQAAKYGIEVDPETYWTLVGFFGLLLGSQAATDLGKAKAEIESRNIQSGRASVRVLLAVAAVGLALAIIATCAGCSGSGRAIRGAAGSVVDCTTERALELAKEYGPSVELALRSQLSDTGKINRDGLRALAGGFATDLGRCVLAREVAKLLQPRGSDSQSTPLPIDPADVRAAWDEVRGAELGGKTFDLGGA